MAVKRGGLGRNLSALLSTTNADSIVGRDLQTTEYVTLAIDALQPGKYQPRGGMDETALTELADSIKKQGLLQPIVVRALSPGRYEIIAGERRWRACQIAELTEVPVVLRQVNDETAMAMALIENLQRENLNAMDQARAMQRLTTEFALTHQQVADLLSQSRAAVSNYLRLLHLSQEVRQMLEDGEINMGHARSLLNLPDHQQYHVAQLITAKHLSVRETEALVARIKADASQKPKPLKDITPLFESALQQLEQQLQTKVKIKHGKAGKGTLVIHYEDVDNLGRVLISLVEAKV